MECTSLKTIAFQIKYWAKLSSFFLIFSYFLHCFLQCHIRLPSVCLPSDTSTYRLFLSCNNRTSGSKITNWQQVFSAVTRYQWQCDFQQTLQRSFLSFATFLCTTIPSRFHRDFPRLCDTLGVRHS